MGRSDGLTGVNDAATDDLIFTIEDRGLPGTEGTLRRVEMNPHGVMAKRLDPSGSCRRGISNFHGNFSAARVGTKR